MSGNRARDEEPQEEFLQEEGTETKKEKETDAGSKKPNYQDWDKEQLKNEARKKEIDNYEELQKEELVRKLKNA